MRRYAVGAGGILAAAALATTQGRAAVVAMLILWLAARGRKLNRETIRRQHKAEEYGSVRDSE